MDEATSVLDLFSLAIQAEKAAEALYQGLAKLFMQAPDIADFWRKYAAEEQSHAAWLIRMRDNLTPEQLAAPASPDILIYAHHALHTPVEELLVRIRNLQDAYDLVNDVESSETNAVFTFILENYPVNDEVLTFLQKQLEQHVSRLIYHFPARYGSVKARLQVKAQHDS